MLTQWSNSERGKFSLCFLLVFFHPVLIYLDKKDQAWHCRPWSISVLGLYWLFICFLCYAAPHVQIGLEDSCLPWQSTKLFSTNPFYHHAINRRSKQQIHLIKWAILVMHHFKTLSIYLQSLWVGSEMLNYLSTGVHLWRTLDNNSGWNAATQLKFFIGSVCNRSYSCND